ARTRRRLRKLRFRLRAGTIGRKRAPVTRSVPLLSWKTARLSPSFISGPAITSRPTKPLRFVSSSGRIWPATTSPDSKPSALDYYRQARKEFARLYKTYNLNPPGAPAGSHASLCRDIYRNLDTILAH